jgi:hypothetical protein
VSVPTQPRVLWEGTATDVVDGTVAVRATAEGHDHLGLSFQLEDGTLRGLCLDRADVQALRHVITAWLVGGCRS